MLNIFAANWKMHKKPQEAREFLEDYKENLARILKELSDKKKSSSLVHDQEVTIVFFPSSPCLEAVGVSIANINSSGIIQPNSIGGSISIEFGAQNAFHEIQGAFTGEISPQVVKDLGGQWLLIGHSERRQLFGETDVLINKKITSALQLGLRPMLCIGETLQEREQGQTQMVIHRQLERALSGLPPSEMQSLVVAYEPVWAIGTGKVATPQQVQETHLDVRNKLLQMGISPETPILYGGSVKSENSSELIQIPHVNGFLVGGASLQVSSFVSICRSRI